MDYQLSAPLDDFKDRELEIINMMANGLSNQEIADQLFITKGTVRWYNKQIYSKLGTSRRTEAIALAREMGLIGEASPSDTVNVRHTPPITTGPFIGRDEEISELAELLQNPEIRLLSIIATGGMGKSRLSLELGHLLKPQYEDGVAFIDLTSIRNPDDIAKFAVASLGMTITSNQAPEEILFNYCRDRELLLIFDNFEHVLSGASLLSDMLEVAPNIKIIASSRERLNLRAETVFYLQPVSQYGDALFIEVASMMRPSIVITDDDLVDIQQIVALVGGLPLGLILAATWVDTLSFREIAEEIQANLDFLSAEMGDMPERQQSIHAVIDPTWKRLNEKEKKAFMWASVFRGGFTRATFQQVTGASVRTIQTLLNRSLIGHGHGRRYDMHPLLRQYAREQLIEHNMLEDAKNTHLNVFNSYVQDLIEQMFSGQYLESLDTLEVETDNIRAALDWSLKGNHIEMGVALILANSEFWLARSRIQEAITYVEKALRQSDHPMLYYWQSVYLDRLGQIDRSTEAAQKLIGYGKANQDKERLAYGQFRLGLMRSKIEAKLLFEDALANALSTDNQHLIAHCHIYLSLVDSKPFSIDDPRSHSQQALKIFQSLGDLHGISRVTNNIAIQYYDDPERLQEAKALINYSLQLKREIGDRAGEARRLTTLSMWAMAEEEYEQAQEWLMESREICEELGEVERLSYVLSTEGLLYLLMMDLEKARSTLDRNLQLDIDLKAYRGVADVSSLLCQLHLIQNNPTEASRSLKTGFDALAKVDSQPTLLIIIYANYLWYKREFDTAVPIVATLTGQELQTYVGSNVIINNYLLQPLIYRVQQQIGDEAWQHAVKSNEDVSIDQLYQHIIDNLKI